MSNSAAGIVQYIIVRGDLRRVLNWSTGALIAQACHATAAVTHIFREDPLTQQYLADLDNMHKVVLEAPSEEVLKKIEGDLKAGDISYKMWVEQPENIPTCLVLKPYPKDQVQKFFKKLKLFKDD